MTKNEMQYLDSSLIGPAMLFLNQYFNFYIKEYYVLWLCFVSINCIFSIKLKKKKINFFVRFGLLWIYFVIVHKFA